VKIPQLIVIGIAVAMVGGATTILAYTGVQEALAAKTCESLGGSDDCWCYSTAFALLKFCSKNKGECQKAQQSDGAATSGCFRQR
jgi:hypothetical protein